jgi:hypothetical protein
MLPPVALRRLVFVLDLVTASAVPCFAVQDALPRRSSLPRRLAISLIRHSFMGPCSNNILDLVSCDAFSCLVLVQVYVMLLEFANSSIPAPLQIKVVI